MPARGSMPGHVTGTPTRPGSVPRPSRQLYHRDQPWPAEVSLSDARLCLVGEQVAEVGARFGQEPPPGTNKVQFLPPGRADTPVAQFQNARAGDSGDDRRMGGNNGLGTGLG